MSDASLVSLSYADGVGTISLAHGAKLNAMSEALAEAFEAQVKALHSIAGLRAVVVQGEGRAFSAGGDLAFLQARCLQSKSENEAVMQAFYARFLCVRDVAQPTIALVQGRAVGAGLAMALACDLVLVADDATLSLNFVRLGLSPGMGITWSLPRLVGPQRAAELLLTGREFSAQEAVEWGLALGVVPRDELHDAGQALAAAIAKNGPLAVGRTKAALTQQSAQGLQAALAQEAQAQAESYASQDYAEGLNALREKRPPIFGGH